MTSPGSAGTKLARVLPFPNNLYARWRLETGAVPLLRDQRQFPPERLLQAIWQHQRLLRDQLRCLDGRDVRILHPGFISREGGPDFRDAMIQFGQEPPKSGDVEIDVRAGGWISHGHHANAAFRNVILHVIWDGDRSGAAEIPTLVLRDQLDAPIRELGLWLASEPGDELPERLRGQCCAALGGLSADQRRLLFRQAAEIRFQSKAAEMQSRARQAGWEQTLWEGLFRGLGYKQNPWPMLRLAELRPRWSPGTRTVLGFQARLLGIAGLLPAELARLRGSGGDYLRRLWDCWWRDRQEFDDCRLPVSVWIRSGQRPANHPQRRLALAAHWLASGNLAAKIEHWCAADIRERNLPSSLLRCLQAPHDEFWSWHWTLGSPRLKAPQALLGSERITDLAVNVVLPWLWIRAVEGKNAAVQLAMERRFQAWPAAGDNSILRLARQRLLGAAARPAFRSASEQQGCLQIKRDYCDASDALCRNCRFPGIVRSGLA